MRIPLRTLAAATVVAFTVAACSISTEPSTDSDVLAAAQTFDRIADSLSIAGVDGSVSGAYRELARTVRNSGSLSSVSISVDGVAADFFATALEFQRVPLCPPNLACALVAMAPLRGMVAWQKNDPHRVVQLTADVAAPIGATVPGPLTTDPFVGRATLTFLDGDGGVFLGTSGTQTLTSTPITEPCVAPQPTPVPAAGAPTSCKRADFTVAFSAVVQPPPFALRRNTATGSHAIAMTPQHVLGSVLYSSCFRCGYDLSLPRPPIAIDGSNSILQPSLSVNVAPGNVTLVFTVTNSSAVPIRLDFSSAQQYDFLVRSNATSAVVWQWSANMAFAQMLTSRTLAAGESVSFTEHWLPTSATSGLFTAQALLTSSSHRATAAADFVVP